MSADRTSLDASARHERSPLDDRALLELSAEPEAPLCPLLRRADEMAPLVLVIAFLASLYSVGDRSLSDRGARHAELSLRLLNADTLDAWLEPAIQNSLRPDVAPSLMDWLVALSMKLLGPASAAALTIVPAVCTAGLIFAVYLLGRNLHDGLLGLIAAFLLACNPYVLALAQEPVPESAALLFAVLSAAATVAHWRAGAGIVSLQLLAAGVFLGLCWLSGGTLVFELLVILFVYASGRSLLVKLRKLMRPNPSVRPRRRVSLSSLLILAVTAFAVGGWRTLLLASNSESATWADWFRDAVSEGAGAFTSAIRFDMLEIAARFNEASAPIVGLVVLGLACLLLDIVFFREEPTPSYIGLIAAWLAVIIGSQFAGYHSVAASSYGTSFGLSLAVPLSLMAANGVREIVSRRASFPVACVAALMSLANMIWLERSSADSDSRLGLFYGTSLGWTVGILIAVIFVATAVSIAVARERDGRRRALLTGALGALALSVFTWGVAGIPRSTPADRQLAELRARLRQVAPPSRLVFLSLNSAPQHLKLTAPQLEYVVRSVWSDSEFVAETATWEDAVARLRPPAGSDSADAAASNDGPRLIIAWGPRARHKPHPDSTLVRLLGPPAVYQNLDISVYSYGDAL